MKRLWCWLFHSKYRRRWTGYDVDGTSCSRCKESWCDAGCCYEDLSK